MICLSTTLLHGQSIQSLRTKINEIISARKAVVGVAIAGNSRRDTLSIGGDQHFPMQSVFKFHIGLVVMSECDRGNLTLDKMIEIRKQDLLPGTHSPIADKYPDGVSLTVREILRYTISQSDNVGCDALLRLIGGPAVVEQYFKRQGFNDISIKINEETMQSNWDLQFQNWTTPHATNRILKAFYFNTTPLLSRQSHEFIWQVMKETSTGLNRLKGLLPPGTTVAHKTGWSGVNKTTNISAAVNDIGIVFLPNGTSFFISVFITDSQETTEANERIIAEIAKVAWDHFTAVTK